jgi:hypothetical protein
VSRRPFGIDIVNKLCLGRRSLLVFFCWGKGSIRECATQVTWCKIEWSMTTVQLGRGRALERRIQYLITPQCCVQMLYVSLATKVFQDMIAKGDFTSGL